MIRSLHRALLGLVLFLAVTATAGGIGLLSGLIAPGTDLLAGSIFPNYIIPGLALLLLVGGGASLAAAEIVRRGTYQYELALFAGAMMVVYELVEWGVIGFHALQAIYLGAGALIIVLSISLLTAPQPAQHRPRTIHRPAHRHG